MAPGPAVGLIVSSPVLTWAMIGRHDVDTYYAFGPYQFNHTAEIVALCGAAVVFAASVRLLVMDRHRPPGTGLSGMSALLLLMFGCFCAWSWRVMTAGVGGANIGAGLLVFVGPVIAASLLIGAVIQQHRHRPLTRGVLTGAAVCAVMFAPLLMLALSHLG